MPETIGQRLHRIRSERNLTLEQIAHATHVRLHYLRALEEDQPNQMPSDAQGRGFLRLYAGYLNISAQPLLDAWPDQILVDEVQAVQDDADDAGYQESLPPAESAAPIVPTPDVETPVTDDGKTSALAEEKAAVGEESQTIPPQPSSTQPSENSEEIFKRIGTALRQQREALGLSLTEIENHTHIRRHYLDAIESGQTIDLPSPAQGRGMLKNYAQFLNMNGEAVLLEYAEGLQIRREEKIGPAPVNAKTQPKTPTPVKKWITPDMIVGISAILLLVVIIVWGISQVTEARKLAVETTAIPIADILFADTNQELAALPESEATVQPLSEQIPGSASQANEAPAPAAENEIPLQGSAPLQLYLVASQRAWVKVTADKEVKFEGRVVPGNAYPFSASDQIDLVSGNAAALKVFFNQQDLGILGEVGQLLNVSFTVSGMQVPTPAVPPTQTATPVLPTVTPEATSTVMQPTPTVTPFVP